MPQKKSIFRQPGAQHFQLVHRSQRDPLIHDPEASQHVLKAFERENVRKGKSRADLENILTPEDIALGRQNIGEASMYNVFYDDTDYDYMQHLRVVGQEEDGVETILLPAPAPVNKSKKGKGREDVSTFLKESSDSAVPSEALPSNTELERNYESELAIPSEIAGFQPDMDPHLRQVLEALDDEAFVDDGLEDDFFGDLVKDGERDEDEDLSFEFDENGLADEDAHPSSMVRREYQVGPEELDDDWMARFARFKREAATQKAGSASDDNENDAGSEGRDTLGGLPRLPVVGGKRRRKGASDASGYSLTSSSMFRNQGLSTLDEQFAKIEEEYASSGEDEQDDDESTDHGSTEHHDQTDSDPENAPQLIPREDFDSLLDDFLDKYEVIGGKVKPTLTGATGAEKLDTLRRAMAGDYSSQELTSKEDRIKEILMTAKIQAERGHAAREGDSGEEDSEDDIPMPSIIGLGKKQDRWDVETILSTYTNLENHPRLIKTASDYRRKSSANPIKIEVDPKTGLPRLSNDANSNSLISNLPRHSPEEVDPASEEGLIPKRQTIARPRNETKEEKQARKQAVQEERQARRIEKKQTKESFSTERNRQHKMHGQTQGAIRKL